MLALDLRSGYVLSRPGSSAVRCWYRQGRRALAAGADSEGTAPQKNWAAFRPSGPAPNDDAGPFSVLRQVIAERGEHHRVQAARLQADRFTRVVPRPGVARHVRVLRAVPETAFGPAV